MKCIRLEKPIEYRFVQYVKRQLYLQIVHEIVDSKLHAVDEYIHSQFPEINLSCKQILILGANNFNIETYQNYYVLRMNTDIKIPGTSFTVYSICNLINNGNKDIIKYPIIDNCIIKMIDNIQYMYSKWKATNVNSTL